MIYDLDKLKEELGHIDASIKGYDEGKARMVEKREEILKHIAASEAILEMHENGTKK